MSRDVADAPALEDAAPLAGARRFIAPATLARHLGVTSRTVTRWCRSGLIEGAEQFVGPNTTWRIPIEALERLGVSEMSQMSQMSENGAEGVPDASVKP